MAGIEAAGRVGEGSPEDEFHPTWEQSGAPPPRGARQVAVRLVTFARDETRANRDVAAVLAHDGEQPPQFGGRMLPIGVDAAAICVAVIERPAVTGGDPDRQTAVGTQRKDFGSASARDLGGSGGPAVVP